MKRRSRPVARAVLVALTVLTISMANSVAVAAATILESATYLAAPPLDDGWLLSQTQFVGARFRVTATTDVTAVGGHLRGSGTIFAAIERVSEPGAMPISPDCPFPTFSTLPCSQPFSATIATTVFVPPATHADVTVPLSVRLTPGTYALIFGSGYFGAAGFGLMAFTNQDLPAASYFHWRGDPTIAMGWVDGGVHSARFVVVGEVAEDREPPTITCPADVSIDAAVGEMSASVAYEAPAATDDVGIVSLTSTPGSGTAFPAGSTIVTATATDAAGNSASCSFVVSVSLTLLIDVRPGGTPNTIALTTRGSIAVAALAVRAFDPITLDPASLRFGPHGTEAPALRCAAEDVNRDRRADLVCHFDARTAGFAMGDSVGTLRGRTTTGAVAAGTDSVRIVLSD
jgi:hypothetical protein